MGRLRNQPRRNRSALRRERDYGEVERRKKILYESGERLYHMLRSHARRQSEGGNKNPIRDFSILPPSITTWESYVRGALDNEKEERLIDLLQKEKIDVNDPKKYGLPDVETLLALREFMGYIGNNSGLNRYNLGLMKIHFDLELIKRDRCLEELQDPKLARERERLTQRLMSGPYGSFGGPQLRISYDD